MVRGTVYRNMIIFADILEIVFHHVEKGLGNVFVTVFIGIDRQMFHSQLPEIFQKLFKKYRHAARLFQIRSVHRPNQYDFFLIRHFFHP
ncbi:hypothetical protein D1872_300310 [compost metagenome]